MSRRQAIAEFALFGLAALAGAFSIGEAFRGNAPWLVVTAAATMMLARQMSRIEDRWPRRRPRRSQLGKQAARPRTPFLQPREH